MSAGNALLGCLAVVLSAWLVAWATANAIDPPMDADEALASLPKTVPAPKTNPTTPEKVALGKQLFFDERLSGDNTMSCASCHVPEKAYTDGLALGKGHGQKSLSRNTPSLLNVGFLDSYFWDGRAASLEEQALGPIQSPEEMNQDLDELERELRAVPEYVEAFRKTFGEPVTRSGIARALAAYQRTLVSDLSPFDRYLAGDEKAISPAARRGLDAFTGSAGCSRCHNGPLLSDGKFYRIGMGLRDPGRFAVTGKENDRAKFRTPPLRDVARTGPYMHDGSMRTLFDVVEYYYRNVPTSRPLGMDLDVEPLVGQSYSEINDVVAFLEALSSEPAKD